MTEKIQRYTQGVCQDGAAILLDGNLMTIDEVIEQLNYYVKAIKSKQNELRDCRSLLDFKRDDIRARDEHIEAQAKEIQKQKESFDALAVTYSELIDENKALEKATDKEIERLEKSLKDAHKKYDILWQETQPNKRNSAAGFNQ